jgi:hypothetical protein
MLTPESVLRARLLTMRGALERSRHEVDAACLLVDAVLHAPPVEFHPVIDRRRPAGAPTLPVPAGARTDADEARASEAHGAALVQQLVRALERLTHPAADDTDVANALNVIQEARRAQA